MIARIWSALKPCDTSAALESLDRVDRAALSLTRQSRALSRTIRCGDPIKFVERVLGDTGMKAKVVLRRLYPVEEHVPDDMVALLAQIDEGRAVRPD